MKHGVLMQEAWANGAGPPLGRELELADLLRFVKRRRIRNVVGGDRRRALRGGPPLRPEAGGASPTSTRSGSSSAGPLHASTYGPNQLDPTFGPQAEVPVARLGQAARRSPADGAQYFGTMRIDAQQRGAHGGAVGPRRDEALERGPSARACVIRCRFAERAPLLAGLRVGGYCPRRLHARASRFASRSASPTSASCGRGASPTSTRPALIEAVLDDDAEVLLAPRPRRFGKTLNLSMLRYFLEKGPEDLGSLFAGLAVASSATARPHFQRYPVIFMTFKDVKPTSWETACGRIAEVLSDAVRGARLPPDGGEPLAPEDAMVFSAILEAPGDRGRLRGGAPAPLAPARRAPPREGRHPHRRVRHAHPRRLLEPLLRRRHRLLPRLPLGRAQGQRAPLQGRAHRDPARRRRRASSRA